MVSVLVVRKRDTFSRLLEQNGFEVINCPATETEVIAGNIEIGPEIQGVFVTSRAAAQVVSGVKGIRARIYVLGRSSFEILKDRGFDVWYSESANTSAEMLDLIPVRDIEGRRLLYVRGESSLRTVPERLGKLATVEEAIVYRTLRIAVDHSRIDRGFDWICFFSPSGAESFIDQVGRDLIGRSRIAAIGPTTSEFLRRHGIVTELVASSSNAVDFARELIEKGEGT